MSTFSPWPYVQSPSFSGDIAADAAALLTANGKSATAAHCRAVAATSQSLALRFGLDAAKAVTAALLHDVAGILNPRDMLDYAAAHAWPLDESERRYPFILHQRMSAVLAAEVFNVRDPLILSAIRCHTTLKADATPQDMVLFLADKLSWDQEGIPPFHDSVSAALNISLAHACLVYIRYVLEQGMLLYPHQWLLEAKAWLETLE